MRVLLRRCCFLRDVRRDADGHLGSGMAFFSSFFSLDRWVLRLRRRSLNNSASVSKPSLYPFLGRVTTRLCKKMHERLNKVPNVARQSVFAHLRTLAFYVAVKSRRVFALFLQSAPPAHSSPCSLFYIPRPLNWTSVRKQGGRFEESRKAERLSSKELL